MKKVAERIGYSPINMAYITYDNGPHAHELPAEMRDHGLGRMPAGAMVWGSGGETICAPCAALDNEEVAAFSRHEVQNLERHRGHTRCDRCDQDMLKLHSKPPTPSEHAANREAR